ncbi:MAG: alpha/beta hydrolase [Acidobacteria bacterium]|nr:alpha/beta hydrolase [Acidobacteriota bacterium]
MRCGANSLRLTSQPGDFSDGTLRAVVVIPGVNENWRFMLPMIRRLHDAGHPVHVVTGLAFNRRPVDESAEMVATYIEQNQLSDAVIVAHSKGGLIGKYAMLKLDDAARISSMVAICSPFSGSRYARLVAAPSLRAFSPRNRVLTMLRAEERVNERIVSIYGRFDPLIPEGSQLPGARNIMLDDGGHFRLLSAPAVLETVLAVAANPQAGQQLR